MENEQLKHPHMEPIGNLLNSKLPKETIRKAMKILYVRNGGTLTKPSSKQPKK